MTTVRELSEKAGPISPQILAGVGPDGAQIPARGVRRRTGRLLGDRQWDEGGDQPRQAANVGRIQAGVLSDEEKADRHAAATAFKLRIIAAEDEFAAILNRWLTRRVEAAASKVKSEKSRRHTRHWDPPGERPLEAKAAVGDETRWRAELESDSEGFLKHLIARFGSAAAESLALASGRDLAFDAAHIRVSEKLRSRVDRIGDWSDEVTGQIRDRIAEGEQAGLSIGAISQRILEMVAGEGPTWANTVARTEVTSAANGAALDAAVQTGIVQQKQWLATPDERTRESHALADEQIVGIDEAFEVGESELDHPGDPAGDPGETVNCVVGSTEVRWSGGLRSALRHWHDGEVIEIRTADGDALTVTPNHPIFAGRRWAAAHLLRVGDELLRAVVIQPVGAPDVEHVPASIEEVYRAAHEVGAAARIGPRGVDFHGDRPDGEVDVVRAEGELRRDGEARAEQDPLNLALLRSLDAAGPLARHGAGDRALPSSRASELVSATSSIRSLGESAPLGGGHRREPDPVRFGAGTDGQAELAEPPHDDGAADAHLLRDAEHAFACRMSPTKIIEIERSAFHGWVYNLETDDGWFTAANLASHNCRCTMLFLIDNPDGTQEEVDPGEGDSGDEG